MPSSQAIINDTIFALWQRIADFSAGETEAALRCLQEWIAEHFESDNVIWIGSARVLRGAKAAADPFLGWRLRDRVALRPDPEPYRKQLAQYFDSDHYGKLTPTYYERSHEAKNEDHVGMDSRATMAGAGRFRVLRVSDQNFVDQAAFKKSSHYQRYYRDGGITDRVVIGFPVGADHESFFMIDRFQTEDRRPFTTREAARIGVVLRGLPELHRRLLLSHGLLTGDKLLSPMEREIVRSLLTGQTEKEIALSTGRKLSTMHKSVLGLYARFGVQSRQGFMALWLGKK